MIKEVRYFFFLRRITPPRFPHLFPALFNRVFIENLWTLGCALFEEEWRMTLLYYDSMLPDRGVQLVLSLPFRCPQTVRPSTLNRAQSQPTRSWERSPSAHASCTSRRSGRTRLLWRYFRGILEPTLAQEVSFALDPWMKHIRSSWHNLHFSFLCPALCDKGSKLEPWIYFSGSVLVVGGGGVHEDYWGCIGVIAISMLLPIEVWVPLYPRMKHIRDLSIPLISRIFARIFAFLGALRLAIRDGK